VTFSTDVSSRVGSRCEPGDERADRAIAFPFTLCEAALELSEFRNNY